jgi:hypothetical protein
MRAKSLLVSGAVLVSLGLLAGCGTTVSGSPTAAGASTGGTQGGAGSQLGAQVRTVADLSDLVGSSVQQATTAQVKMVSSSSTTTGSIKFGNPVSAKMTINSAAANGMPAEQEQMILVDNIFYMDIPGLSDVTPGKSWFKIDPSDTADPMNALFGSLIDSIKQNADPSQQLKALEAGGTLTGSDTEQLNGQPTTHYKITVNIDKMIANQSDATTKQLLTLAQQKGLTDYPVEMWLNSNGLPVQMTIDMPSISGAGSAGAGGLSTITYSNWGDPVTIAAPPADQVGSLPTGG